MKQYQGSVIVINSSGIVEANIPFITAEEAEQRFLESCRRYISNFDEYDNEDIKYILDNGFEEFGNKGLIAISWF